MTVKICIPAIVFLLLTITTNGDGGSKTACPLWFVEQMGKCTCSYKSFFTRHHQLTSRLVKQGFLYDKLVTSFKGFCSRYPKIFSKFKVSIRKHVEDGICLPTVAINRLSTRVSTR